jgi:hypothetical protein
MGGALVATPLASKYERYIMIYSCLIFLLLVQSPLVFQKDSVRLCITEESFHWLKVPEGFIIGVHDIMEGIDEKDDKLSIALIDLNDDGKPEYIIKTLCGNHSCEYPIYNGKTLKEIGEFFGSTIWILDNKLKGFSTIETYSHQSAERGELIKYVFDGKKYNKVSSKELNYSQSILLFKNRNSVKKLK